MALKKGRKPQFSERQVQRMRDMREEGLRNSDIAKIMRVSMGTVSEYLLGKRVPYVEAR